MTTASGRVLIAADLGATNLRVATGGESGNLVRSEARPLEAREPDAVAGAIERLTHELAGETPPLAACVGCPGLVDPRTGVVLGARNLGWRDVPLAQTLSGRLHCPVRLENDVNMAALGEWWRGAGKGRDDVAFVGVGTGVGAGLILGGKLHRGAAFAAGEVGRLPSGVAGASGAEEGVEDVAGGPAIVRRAIEAGLPAAGLTTARVFELAQSEERATAVVADAIAALARVVAWIAAISDPAVIIIGGGVAQQGERLLAPLRERAGSLVNLRARVVAAALGGDAQLFGALHQALHLAGIDPMTTG